MGERVHTCACGAEFVFRRHYVPRGVDEPGRVNPIELDPVPDGTVAILADGRYRIIEPGEGHEGDRYRSHFAFCPLAPAFRRRA